MVMPSPADTAVSGFVTRNSSGNFKLNGIRVYAAGANAHWLGLVQGGTAYPPISQVDALFDGVAAMTNGTDNIPVVRAFTLASSFGCTACIEPTVGSVNQAAFDHFDAVLESARARGVRLILTFVDQQDAADGSEPGTRQDWVNAFGGGSPDRFFTDTTIRTEFFAYIDRILNHVDDAGFAVKNDPVIFALETGNEMNQSDTKQCSPTQTDPDCDFSWTPILKTWTRATANHFNAVDTKHLIMDGHHMSDNLHDPNLTNDQVQTPGVDIYQIHQSDERKYTYAGPILKKINANNKAGMMGEFAWMPTPAGDLPLGTYLNSVYATWCYNPDGALFWEAWVDNRLGGNQNRLNVQNPENSDQQTAYNLMRTNWTTPMDGHPYPKSGPGFCP